MINKIKILPLIIITVCLFSSCDRESSIHKKNTLILGSNGNYPPYESYNQNGIIEGFDIDVAKAISQKLEFALEIKETDFDALILALNQGKIDILMSGMSITPSRQKKIAMIPYQGDPVKQLSLTFWEKIPPHIKSLQDIAKSDKKVVAVQVGTYQADYLNKIKGIETKILDGTQDLIMDLQYGKSQAILLEPHIADAVKIKFPKIQVLPIHLPKEEWVLGNGIGIKKNRIKLIESIETAVKELKEEGVIHKLEQKWFGNKQRVIVN